MNYAAQSDLFPATIRGAATRQHGKWLVGPVDLDLDGQGTCIVIGPNGSGKTTLLRLLHGIARRHAGHITWGCDANIAARAQSFVFQRPVMLRRSVAENIAYPLLLRGAPKRDALERARDWAERVGIAPFLDRSATVLSGGEQQKLALARALIIEPRLLFLDEPTASLDGRATRDIEAILTRAQADGTAIVLSTHDMGQARRLADQVVFMKSGMVHETAPASEFFDHPATPEARAFLQGDIVE